MRHWKKLAAELVQRRRLQVGLENYAPKSHAKRPLLGDRNLKSTAGRSLSAQKQVVSSLKKRPRQAATSGSLLSLWTFSSCGP